MEFLGLKLEQSEEYKKVREGKISCFLDKGFLTLILLVLAGSKQLAHR